MTRTIDASVLTDLGLDRAEKTELIELNFSGGVSRITTAGVNILWNGVLWTAVGGHLELEGFGESVDASANGNRIKLSGVDLSFIAAILGQNYRGRSAKIWYAHMNPATQAVLGTPILMFDGYMNDPFEITEERNEKGGWVDIGTRLMVRINDLIKVRGIHMNTHSHQASGYTGVTTDTTMQNVPHIVGRKVFWGVPTAGVPTPAVGLPATPPNGGSAPGGGYPGGSGGTGAVPIPSGPGIGGTFPGGHAPPGPNIDQSHR